MQKLIDIIQSPPEDWTESNKKAFEELFSSEAGRYSSRAKESVKIRAPKMATEEGLVLLPISTPRIQIKEPMVE